MTLSRVPGVADVSVNLGTERARIAFDGLPDAAALAAVVRQAGYTIPEATFDLAIGGMTCASCVNRVERAEACGGRGFGRGEPRHRARPGHRAGRIYHG
jgi:copper chaperone CopZ